MPSEATLTASDWFTVEPLESLSHLARQYRAVPSTVRDWAEHGVGGRKLQVVKIGRRLFSSHQRVAEWVKALGDSATTTTTANINQPQEAT